MTRKHKPQNEQEKKTRREKNQEKIHETNGAMGRKGGKVSVQPKDIFAGPNKDRKVDHYVPSTYMIT
jgi:hypothetical protein